MNLRHVPEPAPRDVAAARAALDAALAAEQADAEHTASREARKVDAKRELDEDLIPKLASYVEPIDDLASQIAFHLAAAEHLLRDRAAGDAEYDRLCQRVQELARLTGTACPNAAINKRPTFVAIVTAVRPLLYPLDFGARRQLGIARILGA